MLQNSFIPILYMRKLKCRDLKYTVDFILNSCLLLSCLQNLCSSMGKCLHKEKTKGCYGRNKDKSDRINIITTFLVFLNGNDFSKKHLSVSALSLDEWSHWLSPHPRRWPDTVWTWNCWRGRHLCMEWSGGKKVLKKYSW